MKGNSGVWSGWLDSNSFASNSYDVKSKDWGKRRDAALAAYAPRVKELFDDALDARDEPTKHERYLAQTASDRIGIDDFMRPYKISNSFAKRTRVALDSINATPRVFERYLGTLPLEVGDKNYKKLRKQHRYNLEKARTLLAEKIGSGGLFIDDNIKLGNTVAMIDDIFEKLDEQTLNNGWHNYYDFANRTYPTDTNLDKRTHALFQGEYGDPRYGNPALIQLYLNKIPWRMEKYKNWLKHVKIPFIRDALLRQLGRERPNDGAEYRSQLQETIDTLNKAIDEMPSLEQRLYDRFVKEPARKNGSRVRLYDEHGKKLTPETKLGMDEPASILQLAEGSDIAELYSDSTYAPFETDGWMNAGW